jgi:YHS domain-containing protein
MTGRKHITGMVLLTLAGIGLVCSVQVAACPQSDTSGPTQDNGDQAGSDSPTAQTSQAAGIRIPVPLQAFNPMIGSWRGVGQPKRGSRQGAWIETADCRWDFTEGQSGILLQSENGKQYQTLRLKVDASGDHLVLTQVSQQAELIYTGDIPDKWPGHMELTSVVQEDGAIHRCTIDQLSDIRLVMLFESGKSTSTGFRRTAGIGYTRSGAQLAVAGGPQRKCVVTGGQGTIPVSYQGKTWYVCCQGCRQAFEAAPDEIIAEYRRALAEEAAAAKP